MKKRVFASLLIFLMFSAGTSSCKLKNFGYKEILLKAKPYSGTKASHSEINSARRIIKERVGELNLLAAVKIKGSSHIIVRLKGRRDFLAKLTGDRMTLSVCNKKDVDQVVAIAKKRGLLEFKPVKREEGKEMILGPTVMTGGVEDAHVGYDELEKPKINIEFTSKGSKQFDEVAKEYYQQQLAIIIDGTVMSAPTIQATEFYGRAEIVGEFSLEEAKQLASVLETGELPVKLEVEKIKD